MLQFLARLSEIHVDPTVSDPHRIQDIPDDARSEEEGRPDWPKDDLETKWRWSGLFSDVGIYSETEWNFIMAKCMASMGMLLTTVAQQHIAEILSLDAQKYLLPMPAL